MWRIIPPSNLESLANKQMTEMKIAKATKELGLESVFAKYLEVITRDHEGERSSVRQKLVNLSHDLGIPLSEY